MNRQALYLALLAAVCSASPAAAKSAPPVVSITSPKSGATVAGKVEFSAAASDDFGVYWVDFLIDGRVTVRDYWPPYAMTWATLNYADGAHTLTARAYDGELSFSEATLGVVVQNQPVDKLPTVSILSPLEGATVAGSIEVRASAADDWGVSTVQFYVDGKFKAQDFFAPYSEMWDTKAQPDGDHTVLVRAYDGKGQFAEHTVRVRSLNTPVDRPPTVAITSPAPGARLSGKIELLANASDDRGVLAVEFLIDGQLLISDPTAPYSASVDLGKYPTGAHTLTARARDTAGAPAESSISIEVLPPPPFVFPQAFLDEIARVGASLTDQRSAPDSAPAILISIVAPGTARTFAYGTTRPGTQTPPDENSILEIGSITKVLTGILLAQAQVDGRLNINDEARLRLPGSPVMPEFNGGKILLKHLSAHLSGLPGYPDNIIGTKDDPTLGYTREMLYDYLARYKLRRAPGSQWEYSNMASAMAGMAAENAYGLDYERLFTEKIGTVLGLSDTSVVVPTAKQARYLMGYRINAAGAWEEAPRYANGLFLPSGGIRTSAKDMAALMGALAGNGTSTLAQAINLARSPVGTAPFGQMGLGFELLPRNGATLFTKGGSTPGFSSFLAFYPDLGAAVWIGGNSNDLHANHHESVKLLDLLAGYLKGGAVAPQSPNPTVYFTAPVKNATVSGNVEIGVDVVHDKRISRVAFLLDGVVPYGWVDYWAPYSLTWKTASASNGPHTLTARVYDINGNMGEATLPLTVQNVPRDLPPTISFDAPASGATVAGSVEVRASAADDWGVSWVEFYLDGIYKGYDLWPPYSLTWNSENSSEGEHTLVARAYDTAGQRTDASRIVVVNNAPPPPTPPTVEILSPAQGVTIFADTLFEVRAEDAQGVARVDFLIDNALAYSDLSAPFSFELKIASLGAGRKALKAVAYDKAGTSASAERSITVGSFEQTPAPPLPPNVTPLGAQKTLVVPVTFTKNPTQPWSKGEISQLVFGEMDAYFREASYGQTWFTGEVLDWRTLNFDLDASCEMKDVLAPIDSSLRASGIDLGAYQRFIYVLSMRGSCKASGVSQGVPSTRVMLFGSVLPQTLTHEMGHALGLEHASSLTCVDPKGGARGVTLEFENTLSNCTALEYGDAYSVMGMGTNWGHFSATEKERLGWLKPAEIVKSGTYSLQAISAQEAGTKGLRIPISYGGLSLVYYLTHREPLGFDAKLAEKGLSGVYDGVLLHARFPELPLSKNTYLLDASAQSRSDGEWIPLGATFEDGRGLKIRPLQRSGNAVQVEITLPGGTLAAAGSDSRSGTPLEAALMGNKFLSPALQDGINDAAVFGADASEVEIFDMLGRKVFAASRQGAGQLQWDCRDGSGRLAASGVYIARVRTARGATLYQSFALVK